jgi:DNA-binding response OmpR family regulator
MLLAGKFSGKLAGLPGELEQEGFTVVRIDNPENPVANLKPDIAVVDFTSTPAQGDTTLSLSTLTSNIKSSFSIPIIALFGRDTLHYLESSSDIDDFTVIPYYFPELLLRIKQTMRIKGKVASENVIRHGDLLIDMSSYQVYLAGKPVDLTYKEYELLRFLASNPGKAFSRETLLSKVWGYDYYGGDRTVDVHIRRLRSKVEDATHSFIETVHNVGYRFRKT